MVGVHPRRWTLREDSLDSRTPASIVSLSDSRRPHRVAVIDLGSNSVRMVVAEVVGEQQFATVEEERIALQLSRTIDNVGAIPREAVERCVAAVGDFVTVATGAGAASITAVATSAIRDATNGPDIIELLRDTFGIEARIASGPEEAVLAASGALRALPVDSGAVIDIGGGSAEVAEYRSRRVGRTWTFPLGALRTSDTFQLNRRGDGDGIAELRKATLTELRSARVPKLPEGGTLIGTGGTIRNLARLDRRGRSKDIDRLHGHRLSLDSTMEMTRQLASMTIVNRMRLDGLRPDRADSIVGGAVVLETMMDYLGANEILVSGYGLREGALVQQLGWDPIPASEVRRLSVEALLARITGWNADRAERRRRITGRLIASLAGDLPEEVTEAAEHAALLLDLGALIDYHDRHFHTADIVVEADLAGFDHRGIALIAQLSRMVPKPKSSISRYKPSLSKPDHELLQRAAALVALAEAIDRRLEPDVPAPLVFVAEGERTGIVLPAEAAGVPESLLKRVNDVTGREVFTTTQDGPDR